ncbi:MAG TPA: hypothetical protein VMU55_05845 [Solirubrobacteraceae bacterium]|nr:hypothetical protein [Solirubrobacteraceae bacterium]
MSDTSRGEEHSEDHPAGRAGGQKDASPASDGILASLPRTRPQRSSPRRDAARQSAKAPKRAPTTASTGKQEPPKVSKAKAPAGKRAKRTPPKLSHQDPAPRQGFESESDPVSGPVRPPGPVDVLASAAELAGELGKTGLTAGGRLLKDLLSRLTLS